MRFGPKKSLTTVNLLLVLSTSLGIAAQCVLAAEKSKTLNKPKPTETSPQPEQLSRLNSEVTPKISEYLREDVLKRVLDREIMSHASLEELPGNAQIESPFKKYTIYSTMLVREGLTKSFRILTDYKLYKELVPYVDRADYDEFTKVLKIEGGIWKFKMVSAVKFEEKSDRWIRYQIIGGHFKGMEGDILFEPQGDKGTLVMARGESTGSIWPPKFVIERGAEIVFGFTASRMRSYIENLKLQHGSEGQNGQEIPKPRNRL